jgi:hypothetical protein
MWHGRKVIPTFHPAAILHGGGEKSRQFGELQEDFALIQRTLTTPPPAAPPATAPSSPAPSPSPASARPLLDLRREEPPPAVDDDQLELF